MTEIEAYKILSDLSLQEERERVSPKLEAFRNQSIGGNCLPDIKIKGCRGGRGAGAKSYSMTSLICQRAEKEKLRIACFREIQGSIEESVYYLIQDRAEYLGYEWSYKDNEINTKSGSHFIFKGLKDLRASRNIKGLAKFDIFFVEEAATISMESWNFLLPTLMRNPGAELWFCYNPEEELDPVTEKIWNRERKDALCIELLPGKTDNPWWNEGLQTEMDEDYKFDPDEAEHIWGGQPRKQGQKSVMSRAKIRQAMDRNIIAEGGISVGADIARFGDDKTQMYKRKGLKVIDHKQLEKTDLITTANIIYDFAGRDPSIPIKVDDTGLGGGVTDMLKKLGAKVIPINNASKAEDQDKYYNIISQMWFDFPIDEVDLPNDPDLMKELAGRQYKYDNKNRRQIEPKEEFKKRYGKSPDKADAILLCFWEGSTIQMSDKTREALRARRAR